MSERLPTLAHPPRPLPGPGPRARRRRLLDLVVPARALEWGQLTVAWGPLESRAVRRGR